MNRRQIAVLGECVADAFTVPGPDEELTLRVHPGGGPANTAVALARLGTPTAFLGRLSRDVFGGLFRRHLSASGVDFSLSVDAAEPSVLSVIDLAEDGSPSFSFHSEGAADWQWRPEELDPTRLTAAGTSCLHTGSLALAAEPGAEVISVFLASVRPSMTVSIDPNLRPRMIEPGVYRRRMPEWCELADLIRLSDADLALLSPDTPVEAACDTFHAAGVPLVVVTLGGAGALASLHGERVRVAAPPAEMVDTVGAGDSFTAGLLHRLGTAGLLGGRLDTLSAEPLAAALEFAVRVATHTVSVPGADPPWAADLLPEPPHPC
jgi:fructokinase